MIRRRHLVPIALLVTAAARNALGGMQDIIDAVQASEFQFVRTTSEVPFYPLGWAQDAYYPHSQLKDEAGVLPGAEVMENTADLGLVLPVYVAKRDMVFAGTDFTLDHLDIRSGPYSDQTILRLTPVAGWLHQFGSKETVGAFVAPIFSKELLNSNSWGTSGYGGIVGMHWFDDQFQALYGGVYQYEFGESSGLPYLGLMWAPSPKCSLALVFPWPTFSYVPRDRWLLQLGLYPGGSSWVRHGENLEMTQTFGSWNLNAGVAYRMSGKFWLFAGPGVAGLRGLQIDSGNGDQTRFESKPGLVLNLALQFRP